jgi:hypothetical protein
MFDAWDVTLNGALIPLIMKEWGLDRSTAALMGTSNLIGMALGAFVFTTVIGSELSSRPLATRKATVGTRAAGTAVTMGDEKMGGMMSFVAGGRGVT